MVNIRVILAAIAVLIFPVPGQSQSVDDARNELMQMRQLDQQGREDIQEIRNEFGNESPQLSTAWEKQNAIDAENMARLEEIIQIFGWPTISTFGEVAASAAFLILQHSDLDTQKKYRPIFQQAVEDGEARGSSYALLYDRILMGEGKKQLYGSQVTFDQQTRVYYVWPIEDEDGVDERRAALGMPAMEEYIELFPFEIQPAPEHINAESIE